MCPFRRSRYIDFTVNKPEEVKPQTNSSCVFVRFMSIKRFTRCSHLFPVNDLRNDIFTEGPDKVSATETCFHWTILNNIGYCCASSESPSQVSSQNLVLIPSPTLKKPLLKKSSLTFISPFQNGESKGLTVT